MDGNNQENNNNNQDNIELGVPKKEQMKSPRSTGCKKKPYMAMRYLSRRPAPPPRHYDRHQSREDAELPIVRAVRPGSIKKVITFESLLMDEIKVEIDFEDKYQEIEAALRKAGKGSPDKHAKYCELIWEQSQVPPKKVTLDYQACGDIGLNISMIPHNSSLHPHEEPYSPYASFQQFIMNELINGMGVPPLLHLPLNNSNQPDDLNSNIHMLEHLLEPDRSEAVTLSDAQVSDDIEIPDLDPELQPDLLDENLDLQPLDFNQENNDFDL